MLSYSKKDLKFVITLNTGNFGSSANNQITLQGFRATTKITNAGGQMAGQAEIKIYGVKQADMNQLTMLNGLNNQYQGNSLDVYAVLDGADVLVFTGNIQNAWADYQSMPDVNFYINAMVGYYYKLKPVAPISFKGPIDLVTLATQIGNSMGFVVRNNGVALTLTDVALDNTGMEQFIELMNQAGIDYYIKMDQKIIDICPKGSPVFGLSAVISAQSGLIGYPTFDSIGVNFTSLFNPSIQFGSDITIESDANITNVAGGAYVISSITHLLDSEKPGGNWFSQIRALRGNFVPRI